MNRYHNPDPRFVADALQAFVAHAGEFVQDNFQEQIRFMIETLMKIAPDPAAVADAIYDVHTDEARRRQADPLLYARDKADYIGIIETHRKVDLAKEEDPEQAQWKRRSLEAAHTAHRMWENIRDGLEEEQTTRRQVDVTPGLAQQMLINDRRASGIDRFRDEPRPPRYPDRKHVEQLAALMTEGKWVLSASPIMVDDRDQILDGRARLFAVVESGVTSPFLIEERPA